MNQHTLKNKIIDDMKEAMRAKDTLRLGTIRMLLAAIKQKEVDERIDSTDEWVLSIIEKSIKQRKDSIEQFIKADRPDLVKQEQSELLILQAYQPIQMSNEEIIQAVIQTKIEIDAHSIQDIGKLMGVLKTKLKGKADMTQVSLAVKSVLSN